MKKLTLKWKVTLWYASMLLVLVLLLFGFLFSVSDQRLRSESVSALEEEVWDFIDEIEVGEREGAWHLDDSVRFYKNGVIFSLYDSQGRLVAGDVPEGFPEDTVLKAFAAQELEGASGRWTVYDAAIPYGDGMFLWVRGTYEANALTSVEEMLFRLLLIACPLLIAVALLVGYSITRKALQPMEEIRRTAEKIGSGGDLSLRIPVERTQGEVRQLADTFNRMFGQLEASFEKERQFTSDASHELRTPVSVIMSQAEYALLPDVEPEERTEGLKVILEQARRMSGLLSQLLLLARADNGREQLEKEQVNMNVLIMDAMEAVRKKAAFRKIELSAEEEPGLFVCGDRTSLLRVFQNLLENAVQYGKDGGHVRVTVYKEAGNIVCKVEDDGIGIAGEHLDKIWNRFYRVDEARGTAEGNSGLGLPIVKWIVEQHGGTIEAESRPGEGSCFTVRLPEDVQNAETT